MPAWLLPAFALLASLCAGGGSWQRARIVQGWGSTTPGLGGAGLGLLSCSITVGWEE